MCRDLIFWCKRVVKLSEVYHPHDPPRPCWPKSGQGLDDDGGDDDDDDVDDVDDGGDDDDDDEDDDLQSSCLPIG